MSRIKDYFPHLIKIIFLNSKALSDLWWRLRNTFRCHHSCGSIDFHARLGGLSTTYWLKTCQEILKGYYCQNVMM